MNLLVLIISFFLMIIGLLKEDMLTAMMGTILTTFQITNMRLDEIEDKVSGKSNNKDPKPN